MVERIKGLSALLFLSLALQIWIEPRRFENLFMAEPWNESGSFLSGHNELVVPLESTLIMPEMAW